MLKGMRRNHVVAGRSIVSSLSSFTPTIPFHRRLVNARWSLIRKFTGDASCQAKHGINRPSFVKDRLIAAQRAVGDDVPGDGVDADYKSIISLSQGNIPPGVLAAIGHAWHYVGRMIEIEHKPLPSAKLRHDSYPASPNVLNAFWRSLTVDFTPPNSDRYNRRDRIVRAAKNAMSKKVSPDSPEALEQVIRSEFYIWYAESQYSGIDWELVTKAANLRYPNEWFAWARRMRRKIVLHIGPTNSGKTYNALKRLEQAQSGIYCGPLRLLAHEVYTRLNAQGTKCALLTGDDRRYPDNDQSVSKVSCTVEMAPKKAVDVVVVDEIQMIGDDYRGGGWTDIILGADARELHLCGEERALPIIQKLAAFTGDELEIHRYKRLSPLKVAPKSLDGDLKKLRKGDCMVCFSVVQIHRLKRKIQILTGKNVAIVYGALPPETRAQQAKLFNDPDNDYDYLVASDAVGMGLNLSIKRVIFHTLSKKHQGGRRQLFINEIKQIAGRAGRYRAANQDVKTGTPEPESIALDAEIPIEVEGSAKIDDIDASPAADDEPLGETTDSNREEKVAPKNSKTIGWVTTLLEKDHPILVEAMEGEAEPIETAGLQPPSWMLHDFAGFFEPGTPFSYIYRKLVEHSQLSSVFHFCDIDEKLAIADAIESVDLTFTDRTVFSLAPAGRSPFLIKIIVALARCVSEGRTVTIADMEEIPLEALTPGPENSALGLSALEDLHKAIVLYLWLSYRFNGVFTARAMAVKAKEMTQEQIEKSLGTLAAMTGRERWEEKQRHLQELANALLDQTAKDGVSDPKTSRDEEGQRDGADGEPLAYRSFKFNTEQDKRVEEKERKSIGTST
ncbi:P-loop containing nucleoside triphosphate hydrolase protein [Eremomyces bilateralis CBS 781.70]|uniref:RNA helicase n=1 Tax=Eremomyces bilateralis CBS 781.70 TaxID=1392243 RepID=A0A6G1G869_9PEZI|nr:P-loop containing nucleoside triphosphate hydrolase protein [Eremomyces bilateralis CBS 781.70]KAF1814192.1 P-loop containing nucleoside triphosphate hydrolase protein [Eremomyces bilateralis CBS 781.70]